MTQYIYSLTPCFRYWTNKGKAGEGWGSGSCACLSYRGANPFPVFALPVVQAHCILILYSYSYCIPNTTKCLNVYFLMFAMLHCSFHATGGVLGSGLRLDDRCGCLMTAVPLVVSSMVGAWHGLCSILGKVQDWSGTGRSTCIDECVARMRNACSNEYGDGRVHPDLQLLRIC